MRQAGCRRSGDLRSTKWAATAEGGGLVGSRDRDGLSLIACSVGFGSMNTRAALIKSIFMRRSRPY